MSESKTLYVDKSFMQAQWRIADVNQEQVERISRVHDVPDIIARLLAVRNIPEDKIGAFLEPTLQKHFPDPFSMKGMERFADDIAEQIITGKKIGIFGDFDVDGATSTAILVRFFRHLGQDAPFYIPDRIEEGYGPNVEAMKTLKGKGVETVLICDCGVTAFDVIKQGRDMGLDIAVLDHHEPEDSLPNANHVIDPKRHDDNSELDMLAACGVVFLACVAINSKLREKGFYKNNAIAEAPLKEWLDLVALGTVCDMVPLTGANRLFVKHGFRQMAFTKNDGVKALLSVAKIEDDPTVGDAGYKLGPRINAGSRVHQADLGAKLLSTENKEEAKNIAWLLDDCNEKRKKLQAEMLNHAVNLVEEEKLHKNSIIIVGHENWHPGVSGLIAGDLKNKYNKPAIAVTYAKNEKGELEGRGSGRSVPGVNLGQIFHHAKDEELLISGGGHKMAAGFTIKPEKIKLFTDFVENQVQKQLKDQDRVTETEMDLVLSISGATVDLVKNIDGRFGPFGQEHPEPLFVFPNVRLHQIDVLKGTHIKAMLSDWEGSKRIKAIAFKAVGTPLGEAFEKHGYKQPFHIAGHLRVNRWQGRESVELHVVDADYAMAGNAVHKLQA